MTTKILCLLSVLSIISLASIAVQAEIFGLGNNDDDLENAKITKITIVEAINKVTKMYDGVIITATLEEKENDKLVYEIDLVQNDKEMEVWVDAKTGQMSQLMDD